MAKTNFRPVPRSPEGQSITDGHRAEQLREEQPVVDALRSAGYDVETIWDLTTVDGDRCRAVKILLEQFSLTRHVKVRSTIGHVLNIPEAREHWSAIVALYRAEKEVAGTRNQVKHSIAGSLCQIADDHSIADVVNLAEDQSHGDSRALLFPFLAKKRPVGTEALHRLTLDPVLGHLAKVMMRAGRMGKL